MMWNKVKDVLIAFVMKLIGYKKIDPDEKKREKQAEAIREMELQRQKDEWEAEKDEWENATDDEKRNILLRRFRRPTNRD